MTELLTDVHFWCAICVLAVILIVLAIIKSYLKKLTSGHTSAAGANCAKSVGTAGKNSYPYELTLTVDGMNCAKYATRIENMLNRQEGVLAQADVYTRKVTIRFQNKADADRFCHNIKVIHPRLTVKVKKSGILSL